MPGKEKTVSMTTTPPRLRPKSMASTVMVGSSALRSAWRTITTFSGRPLARAYFT
ncbi:hypothetical protein D3C72_2595970 [compost metagenome]